VTPSTRPSRHTAVSALAVAALLFAGCTANRSSMTHSWVDPAHEQKLYEKILVIALVTNADTRRIFETQLSEILRSNGIAAVPSFTVMDDAGTMDDKEAVREKVRVAVAKSKVDAVTITHLVRTEVDEYWIEGASHVIAVPNTYHDAYYGYGYSYGLYEMGGAPDRLVEDKNYVLETIFFDAASAKRVWAGTSETLNPKDAVKGIDSVGRLIVSTLKKEGVLGK
jgi:hypothetical protein